jgi:serine/threonine-protein kinase
MVLVGRMDDCNIVLPENTVSRHHCLIDIAPPAVMVQDFGSLNGTYLNDEKIGQRGKNTSAAETVDETGGSAFSMKSGDRLRLGKDCEITLKVELSRSKEKKEEKEKKGAKETKEIKGAKEKKQKQPSCGLCSASLNSGERYVCVSCRMQNPEKARAFVMEQVKKSTLEAMKAAGCRHVKMLGQGAMGWVFLVEEEATGKQLAWKQMQQMADVDEQQQELFLREADILGQLDHKNIVRQYACGHLDDLYFLLLEFCKGGSADKLIAKKGGKLGVDLATNITLQVLDGLSYAHGAQLSAKLRDGSAMTVNGVVHRDFKPGNIFLTGSGKNLTAKVGDFGLAKAFESAGLSGITATGAASGTMHFMPKDQILDFRSAKPAVDVWAAAASYYCMLTGSCPKDFPPYNKRVPPDAYDALCYKVLFETAAVPILKRDPSIPPKLAKVIDHALQGTPIAVQSAAELKKMIEGAL